jgi:Flp pilus assembly protein TadB
MKHNSEINLTDPQNMMITAVLVIVMSLVMNMLPLGILIVILGYILIPRMLVKPAAEVEETKEDQENVEDN